MTDSNPVDRRRPVRSFVLRKGRLTEAQSRALEELSPVYELARGPRPVDLRDVFGRCAPVVVEVGFGNGEATWQMAAAEPDKDFIGIEVHAPGVGHLMLAIEDHQLTNVRIARRDAVEFLRDELPPDSISELRIFFPDPWPKKRHHKRRIIQPAFLELVEKPLKHGGLVHVATDWQPYAEHIREVFDANPLFKAEQNSDAGDRRPRTKYEQRGQRLGHEIADLVYRYQGKRNRNGE